MHYHKSIIITSIAFAVFISALCHFLCMTHATDNKIMIAVVLDNFRALPIVEYYEHRWHNYSERVQDKNKFKTLYTTDALYKMIDISSMRNEELHCSKAAILPINIDTKATNGKFVEYILATHKLKSLLLKDSNIDGGISKTIVRNTWSSAIEAVKIKDNLNLAMNILQMILYKNSGIEYVWFSAEKILNKGIQSYSCPETAHITSILKLNANIVSVLPLWNLIFSCDCDCKGGKKIHLIDIIDIDDDADPEYILKYIGYETLHYAIVKIVNNKIKLIITSKEYGC